MSLKPGIGAEWYRRYSETDVLAHDFVVHDGTPRRVPKYYDKLLKRAKDVREDHIKFAREQRAKLTAADNTDDRRRVREAVHLAKVETLKRNSA